MAAVLGQKADSKGRVGEDEKIAVEWEWGEKKRRDLGGMGGGDLEGGQKGVCYSNVHVRCVHRQC